LLLEAAVALAALGYAWSAQERLRLVPVLGLALGFQLLWLAVHLHLAVPGDTDLSQVYKAQGTALLHGRYPRSEYPPGAVLVFAFASWLDPAHITTANRLVMVPFQLGTVGAIWSLRTRYSSWLATVVALWPMNTFHWEFRYDLVPTALLVAGLALALRGSWAWAGIALGAGTATKWVPALAFAALAVWCLGALRPRWATRLSVAFAGAVLALNVPFLIWNASAVAAAYTRQGGRPITDESIWYLMLRLAHVRLHSIGIPLPAGAPRWADVVAVVLQIVLVVVLIAAPLLVPSSLRAGVALAAIAPVVFLLTNRIFSAQYLVTILAAWAVALALVSLSRREQGLAMAAGLVASLANAFVFPFILWNRDRTWVACSVVLFATAVLLTAWIVLLALRSRGVR
jgi:hypothetical protein